MTRVHVAVGSNIDPDEHIPFALERLHAIIGLAGASPFYLTDPISRPEQDPYVNGVIVLETDMDAGELEGLLHALEAEAGRRRTDDPYAARTLDLDIVLWEGLPVDEDTAREIGDRAFLARCLHDTGVDVPVPAEGMDMEPVARPWPLS